MIPRVRFKTKDSKQQWVADLVMKNFRSLQVIEKDRGSTIAKISVDNGDFSLFDTNAILTLVDVFLQWGTEKAITPQRQFALHKVEGGTTVTITFLGGEYRQSERPKKRLWTEDYTTIIATIAKEMGYVPVEIDPRLKEIAHDGVPQYESNPEFLARLARKFGCSWWVDSRGLHFMPREVGKAPKFLLVFRGSLQIESEGFESLTSTELIPLGEPDVKVEYSRRIPKAIKAKGKSHKGGATSGQVASSFNPDAVGAVETFASKSGGSRTSSEVVNDGSNRMKGEGEDVGSRHERTVYRPDPREIAYSNATFDKVEVSVLVEGQPSLRIGDVVEVYGIGGMLEGKYYVKEITHTIDDKGFTQKLKLSRATVKQGKRGQKPSPGPRNTSSIASGGRTKGGSTPDELKALQGTLEAIFGPAINATRKGVSSLGEFIGGSDENGA